MKNRILAAAAAVLALAACKSPILDSGGPQPLVLRFLVSGTVPESPAGRLILPDAKSLDVRLVPLQASRQAPVSRTATIGSGTASISLIFPAMAIGSYAVESTAKDGSGRILYSQSSTLALGVAPEAVTLNLVPSEGAALAVLSLDSASAGSLEPGEHRSYRVPASFLSSGRFSLDLGSTASDIECYIQDQNGGSLSAAPGDRSFVAGPVAGDWAYVTFYNSGTTPSCPYSALVADSTVGAGGPAAPAVYSVTVNGPASLRYGVAAGSPFTCAYAGSPVAYQWYLNGSPAAGAVGAAWTPTPAYGTWQYGTNILMLVVTDSNGLKFSGSLAVSVSN